MGLSFTIRAVRPGASGEIVEVDDAAAFSSVPGSTLYGILERIEDRHPSEDGSLLFPWYYDAFDYDSGGSPTLADCRQPMAVLKSLQRIESELAKMKAHIPSQWTFVVPSPDGSVKRVREQKAFFKGKAVRLFGDDQGCWAVETDTPLGFPPHHELKGKREVPVRLERDGPEIIVGIEEASHLKMYQELVGKLKQVCIVAINHDAVVLTSTA